MPTYNNKELVIEPFIIGAIAIMLLVPGVVLTTQQNADGEAEGGEATAAADIRICAHCHFCSISSYIIGRCRWFRVFAF